MDAVRLNAALFRCKIRPREISMKTENHKKTATSHTIVKSVGFVTSLG